MNVIGKIKIGVLAIAFLINIIFPSPLDPDKSFWLYLGLAFIFAALAIPILLKINAWATYNEFYKPNWNDSPLSSKQPLVFFQFAGYM